MYLRCADCLAYARLTVEQLRQESPKIRCPCGRVRRVRGLRELGATREARFRRALGLCRAERIDLASSYSVLLDLMGLDRAREMMRSGRDQLAELYPRYDPGFRRAVSGGRLTGDQAAQRGDRIVHATRLMLDHELTMNVAFQVADNECTLADAKRRGRSNVATEPTRTDAPAPESRSRLWMIPIAAGIVVGASVAVVSFEENPSVPASIPRGIAQEPELVVETAPRRPNTTVSKDFEGRVTRVYGGTPRDIVEAFCAESPAISSCEPVGVGASTPPRPDVMLGTVRVVGTDHHLWIRRHPGDGSWFAGNGVEPIETRPAGR